MLASWAQWWSSWIWPTTPQQQPNATSSTAASSVVHASDARTTTIIGLTTQIASMSTTNNSTFPSFAHTSSSATTNITTTHFHPSASVLSATAQTTLDYLSPSATSPAASTSGSTITTTTNIAADANSTASLWSTLLSNYTSSWLPSSANGSFSSFLELRRLAENLTALTPGSDALFESLLVNGRNHTDPFPFSSSSGNGAYFETADLTEDELLFRLIWTNASNAADWTTTLRPNDSTNGTAGGGGGAELGGDDELVVTWHLVATIATALVLGFIILATVIGNVFVIAAILLERNLQSVANYLILSLAVADLLVACLVMPLSAVYEVSDEWNMGPELCDMWTSSDVLCCTASILHLVAIALDRYWAVTNIDYIHHRTARRIGVMIAIVWALSVMVSVAPLFGWKDPKWYERVVVQLECLVSQDIGYQIFATASSFYVPLLVILVLYWRIFQTARKRIRRRQQVGGTTPASGGLIASAAGGSGGIAAAVITIIGRPLPTISETTTAFTNVSSANTSPEKCSHAQNGPAHHPEQQRIEADPPTADTTSVGGHPYSTPVVKSNHRKKTHSNSADSKRERKAAKTLAIITGAFVCCWLPFFILAILLPICGTCRISPVLMSLFLWLGYFNSTLNPIIYTIFSPEFRNAFKRILCGKKSSIRRRTGVMRR